ncbi:MAG TPA: PQQ-binding-like beta-propeller repeat protein [Pirellulales bacterium]|jgi:outer membrane protein assembly factor BamB|nr:PQQ-binding-like beta-propeller repeat protein [Pirellulales bacterium]
MGWRAVGLLVALTCLTAPAGAQIPGGPRNDLSSAIQVDEADSATRTHLERVKASIANQQWEEAVDILRQVTESHAGKVLAVSPTRFVSVREYCHLQLASLPAEALDLYRRRVDSQARRWYEQGLRERDANRLRDVVEQLFCSSWGDDALLALGDLALEAGNAGEARGYWEKILPIEFWVLRRPAAGQTNGSSIWLLYPDTDLDTSSVRARLLLAAILDGDAGAARDALDVFAHECGAAEGKLGGRQVNYAEFLGKLLAESQQWPAPKVDREWPTFAGSMERNKVLPAALQAGSIAWEATLPEVPAAEATSTSPRRVAERRNQLLSYHPVLVDNIVLVNTADEIRAYDLASGEPAWGDSPVAYALTKRNGEARENIRGVSVGVGVPRFTMTVRNRRVYARMGSPLTSRINEPQFFARHNYLVCVDLDAEGKLVWDVSDRLDADENDRSWSFEGSPVVDGDGVYVVMRRSGARPQQYVACLDPEFGRLKWRRLVCAAETSAQGQEETTHNLLALHDGTLYLNTNLGAVAALGTRDGQIQWITRYPRAGQGELSKRPKHFYRDLTPCLYHQGTVYIAPADSELLLALDAPTGLSVWPWGWQTPFPDDVIHLLGVMEGKLVASGDKLWWIDALGGKIVSPPGTAAESFPEGGSPKGLGRGLLADGKVYWPTWDKIYVFDQRNNRQLEPINLNMRNAAGGNLLAAGDSLLIASHDRITMFHPESPQGGK